MSTIQKPQTAEQAPQEFDKFDSAMLLKREIVQQVQLGLMSPDDAAETIRAIERGGQIERFGTKVPPGTPGRVWIYVRVSTKDQADHGLSLGEQERQARAWFEFLKSTNPNLVWGGVYVEKGVSAFRNRLIFRRAGRKLHERLQYGDHVIFVRLDRGFRNLKDFLSTWDLWQYRGVNIHFLDLRLDLSTAHGRLFAHIVSAIAEWESSLKSETATRIQAWQKQRGKPVNRYAGIGKKIIGTGRHKRTALDFQQQAVIRLIVRIRNREQLSWRNISDRIEGILAARENRPPARRWERRSWNWQRCQRAYQMWERGDFAQPLAGAADDGDGGMSDPGDTAA